MMRKVDVDWVVSVQRSTDGRARNDPPTWSNHCPDCGQVAELGQDLSPLAIAAIVIGAIGLAIILAAFFFG